MKQLTLLQDFESTILACTPSYAMHLAEVLAENNIDPTSLKLRIGIFGAEPWSHQMKEKIEKGLHIKAYDIYGLSEVMGPGVSCACGIGEGLHVAEDHFYPEIVNPETLESLEYGELGELVFTHLTKEAMPLLRYRTRDLTYLNETPCDCGRTNVRMASVKGRSDDMLIIRGVNVFPSQVESVLLSIPEAKPHYLLVVERTGAMDTLEVKVEIDETYLSDEINAINLLKNRIRHQVESTLGISIKLTIVEPKALERSEGKAKRVLDLRKGEKK